MARFPRTGEVLASYAQILLSGSPVVGALVLLASFVEPGVGAGGLAAALGAVATTRALGLEPDAARTGSYGYCAVLAGCGLATLAPGIVAVLVGGAIAGACAALATASLRALSARTLDLPVLSWPFLAVHFALVLGARWFALAPLAGVEPTPSWVAAHAPPFVDAMARGLGGLIFVPRVEAGLLLAAALALHSRIGALFSLAGFGAGHAIGAWLLARTGEDLRALAAVNAMLSTAALAGVWFVPSPASLAYALAGGALSAAVAAGASALLAPAGLSPGILPFNLVVPALLLAARQRARNASPTAAALLLASPEALLAFHRDRTVRLGLPHAIRFTLPFRGRWVCTQSEDGARTHRGPWRHAFDFEVRGDDGRTHLGAGLEAADYHCFRLPVLAAAAGTVVKVEGGVADNAPGGVDLERNWGNLVVVYHAPGLYSLVAHLAQGSIRVREGQHVARGDVLGLCGSSGRSPVPHLHFQLQATPRVGAPTLPCRFSDVVAAAPDGGARARLVASHAPALGDVVRALDADPEAASLLPLPDGGTLDLSLDGRPASLAIELDLYGRLVLRDAARGATLTVVRDEGGVTALEAEGPAGSLPHALRAALPRLPAELDEDLAWTDRVPLRGLLGVARRTAIDLLAPFVDADRVEVEYTARRDGGLVVIDGASRGRAPLAPPLRTRAVLARGAGLVSAEVTVGGVTRTVRRDARAASSPVSSPVEAADEAPVEPRAAARLGGAR